MISKIKAKAASNVLILQAPVISDKTEAGIFKAESQIAEEKKKMDLFLEVLVVGDNVTNYKVGDRVLVGTVPYKILIDNVECFIIYESNILASK